MLNINSLKSLNCSNPLESHEDIIRGLANRHQQPRFLRADGRRIHPYNEHTMSDAAILAVNSFSDRSKWTTEQRQAGNRLAAAGNTTTWDGLIIFTLFPDIDTLFFRGMLAGNVYMMWGDHQEICNPIKMPGRVGTTFAARGGARGYPTRKVTILLDNVVLCMKTSEIGDVLQFLVHEMVHAYFRVLCNDAIDDVDIPEEGAALEYLPKDAQKENSGKERHGVWFGYVYWSISQILGPGKLGEGLVHDMTWRGPCYEGLGGGFRHHSEEAEKVHAGKLDKLRATCREYWELQRAKKAKEAKELSESFAAANVDPLEPGLSEPISWENIDIEPISSGSTTSKTTSPESVLSESIISDTISSANTPIETEQYEYNCAPCLKKKEAEDFAHAYFAKKQWAQIRRLDIANLRSSDSDCYYPFTMTHKEAAKAAVESFDDEWSQEQRDAAQRLKTAGIGRSVFDRNIVFDLFHDIDIIFFRGQLKGLVYMTWKDINEESSNVPLRSRTLSNEATFEGQWTAKVSIILSPTQLEQPGMLISDVVETLLQEMTTAYFLICAPDDKDVPLPKPLASFHPGAISNIFPHLNVEGTCIERGLWWTYLYREISEALGGPARLGDTEKYDELRKYAIKRLRKAERKALRKQEKLARGVLMETSGNKLKTLSSLKDFAGGAKRLDACNHAVDDDDSKSYGYYSILQEEALA